MPNSEDKGSDKSGRTFVKEISAFQFMAAALGRSLDNPSTAIAAASTFARSGDKTTAHRPRRKWLPFRLGLVPLWTRVSINVWTRCQRELQ